MSPLDLTALQGRNSSSASTPKAPSIAEAGPCNPISVPGKVGNFMESAKDGTPLPFRTGAGIRTVAIST